MEIKTEADDVDEGVSPNELRAVSAGTNTSPNASSLLLLFTIHTNWKNVSFFRQSGNTMDVTAHSKEVKACKEF